MKPKDLTIVPCALIEVRDFVERNHYSHNITGKVYHSRALRTKYKGKYKPFVERLRNKKHLGLLEEIELLGKHCYTYVYQRGKQKNEV